MYMLLLTQTVADCPCTISHYSPPPPPPPPPTTTITLSTGTAVSTVSVVTYPPTTVLAGTTVVSHVPSGPTSVPPLVTAAAGRVGSGIGALGLIGAVAALVL